MSNDQVDCTITPTGNTLRIIGRVRIPSVFSRMVLMAANPIDRMTSYSGSGLPFSCPDMAFANTPNFVVIPSSGEFDTSFVFPNSYYTNDLTQRVPPSVFFFLENNEGRPPVTVRYTLNEPLPLRTLTHRAGRTGPEFYARKADLIAPQTAEGVMRALKDMKAQYDIA